jgi:hypothetical protein
MSPSTSTTHEKYLSIHGDDNVKLIGPSNSTSYSSRDVMLVQGSQPVKFEGRVVDRRKWISQHWLRLA